MSKKKPIPAKLRRQVRERANGCCEYCLIPETDAHARHQVDHVIAAGVLQPPQARGLHGDS
jgi:hypothetical protein